MSRIYPGDRSAFAGGEISTRFRYNFGDRDESPPRFDANTYGPPRRRPDVWERDQEDMDRFWRNMAARNGGNKPNSSAEKPPKPKPDLPKDDPPKRFFVKGVDLNIAENTESNMTDVYECTESKTQPAELVVRRGNYMKITITFDQPYVKEKHDMKLCFSIGKKTSPTKGTEAQIKLDEDGKKSYDPYEWGAYLESQSGNDINAMVHIPADCIVGEWDVCVKTFSEGKNKAGKEKLMIFQYKHDAGVAILFNPWCEYDDVYMDNTKLLNEYILNESGCVYRGSKYDRSAKPWNFGQFEDDILDICLYLLRRAFNTKKTMSMGMADPVKVSRKIVAIINSSDDDGVLEGNWDGDYKDGTSPLKWAESPKILRSFRKDGTVKYGQCWVFSCVTTTLFRCLGIPCRSVTNFASAHDTDSTNVIESAYFLMDDGEKRDVPGMNDSVWNFHVWNEVWFARPDLKEEEYNGWQVVDATPQEKSDGVYTCGPSPVAAIKKGKVSVNYDAAFVFSEVNADQVFFRVYSDKTIQRRGLLKNSIGKFISTKDPDGRPFSDGRNSEERRLDLTLDYKYPEGSVEERDSVALAYSLAFKRKKDFDPYKETKSEEEVKLTLKHNDDVMIGQALEVELTAKNLGFQERKLLKTRVTISPKAYTGETGKPFFTKVFESTSLGPRREKNMKVFVRAEQYFPHLVEQAYLYIEAFAIVSPLVEGGPNDEVTKGRDFTFKRPELEVKGPSKGKVGEEVEFNVTFKNPLAMKLTKCDISMSSSGFKDIEDVKQADVEANGMYIGKFKMIPKRKKEHEVVFTFDSAQLQDINGSTTIVIS